MDELGILIHGKTIRLDDAEKRLPTSLRNKLAHRLLSHPAVRHSEPSVLLSLDDERWGPSKRLLDLAAILARETPSTVHPLLSARQGGSPKWFGIFPGEHYHLLTTVTRLLRAQSIWEFGTDTGMGTLALLEGAAPSARIYTVDIDPIAKKDRPWLTSEDLECGQIEQIVSDMKDPQLFSHYGECLARADLIFVDGPKDGVTEDEFLRRFARLEFREKPIVIFDDIRLMNMLSSWRAIDRPKMDFTSYGHWSGTGLVDWSA